MARLVAMLMVMIMGSSLAHAQGAPQVPPPATETKGEAAEAVPTLPAPQGQVPAVDGQANAVPPVGTNGAPAGATPAAAPDRQSVTRALQEQGREAALKARALQATDPVAANKIMQDYYQLRADKMKEMRDTARTQAAAQRAQKREQARVKQSAAQAERAAVKRDARNARDKQQEVGGRGFPREKASGAITQ